MAAPRYLAEITCWDPDHGATRVLRYASAGLVTKPTDTPANAVYRALLRQPALLSRNAFGQGATFGRSQNGYGEIELANDGSLDGLKDLGFDGRRVVIKRGHDGDAYSAYETVLVGTMDRPADVGREAVRIALRDRVLDLNVPLQSTLYAGDNVLPDGLEGTSDDLLGKPKPKCYGQAFNVPAPCVNTSKLIYQVNDGPVAEIVVYDRGLQLGLVPSGFDYVAHGLGNFDGRSAAKNGETMLVVGGWDGATASPATAKAFRFDGTTWASANPFANASVEALAYGAGVFVAVSVGRGSTPATTGAIATSADNGATWTPRSLPGGWGATECSGFYNVRWLEGPDIFVALTFTGYLCTSPDGITWTARTSGVEGVYGLRDVATDGSIILAVGSGGGGAATLRMSVDNGVTWTAGTTSGIDTAYGLYGIVFGQGQWFTVGEPNGTSFHNGYSATDPTAISPWTPVPVPFIAGADGSYWSVIYEAGYFCAAVLSLIGVAFSDATGEDWRPANNPITPLGTFALILFGDRFYGVGEDVANKGLWASVVPFEYADLADLEDDDLAPDPGNYGVYLPGGYFRLGAPPDGLITADVTEGASASDRTAACLFRAMLWNPLVGPFVPWDEDDLAALDVACPGECGYWTADPGTKADALDLVALTAGAWWGPDRFGVMRIKQLAAPTGTTVLDRTDNNIKNLTRISPNDDAHGIPCYRSIVKWGRLYAVQATDIAGGVSDARRAELSKEWRQAKAEDLDVLEAHPLAPVLAEDSLFATETAAQTEADRRQALRGVPRDPYQFETALDDDTAVLDMGEEIDLASDRYDLSAGEACVVLGLTPDAKRHKLLVTAWR